MRCGQKDKMKIHTVFSVSIFLLVMVAAGMGVFYQTPGAPFVYTTVRGEQATFQGSGLYRLDPVSFAREGIVWDGINLFLGLPLLGLAVFLSLRNSLRGRLLLGGLLFYFFYVYLMYMTACSLNVLFLVYVAIFALSGVAFFTNLHGLEVRLLSARISKQFPRRLFIVFTFGTSAVLIFLWLGRIIPIMISGHFPSELAGLNTLPVQGLDLGFVVPLLLSTGILLWRRSPWGPLLTGISLSYGAMMSVTVPALIAVPLFREGRINLIEAAPFLVVCLAGLFLAALYFRSVREEENDE
jgi:hypothetical protein